MKYRDLADVAFKIFGIFWLVKAVGSLIQLLVVLPKLPLPGRLDTADIIGWTVLIVLYAALGYVLTFRTRIIVQTVKSDESQAVSIEPKETPSAYQRLGLFLLGVFFIVPALSALIPQITKLLIYKKTVPVFPNVYRDAYLAQEWPRLVENSIQFLFGIGLIIGRDRIMALWKRLRPLIKLKKKNSKNKKDDQQRKR